MSSCSGCAIVTGGASGLGMNIVKRLVSKGVRVVFGDISVSKGKELEEELNKQDGCNKENVAVFAECNVTVEEQLRNLFVVAKEKFGGANIMINNAGIALNETIETSTDFIDNIMAINLTAVVKGTSIAIKNFNQCKSDNNTDYCIVNVSSVIGLKPQPQIPLYSLTKAAVINFSQNLEYLKDQGIRVNCVAPGFMETPLLGDASRPEMQALVYSRGGYIDVAKSVDAVIHLIENKKLAGEVYHIDPQNDKILPKPTYYI